MTNKAEDFRKTNNVDEHAWVVVDNNDGTYHVSPPIRLTLAGDPQQVNNAIQALNNIPRVPQDVWLVL